MNAKELRRRIKAARILQVEARKDGSAERIIAAEARLDELLDQLAKECASTHGTETV